VTDSPLIAAPAGVIVDGFIALRWLYRVLAPYNAYQWWVPAEQRAVQCQL